MVGHGLRAFRALSIALLTVSDTRTKKTDKSGDFLEYALQESGHLLAARAIVEDEADSIREAIRAWSEDASIEVIICTGGTGITKRDVTPEVVEDLAEKRIPGFGELFRQLSYEKIGASAIQSRAMAAVIASTLIFVLPGSPSACRDGWNGILRSQLDIRSRPCNFAELLARM